MESVRSSLLSMGKLVSKGWHFDLSMDGNYAYTPNGQKILLHWGDDHVLRMPKKIREGQEAKALPMNRVAAKQKPTAEAATAEFLHDMMNHANPEKIHHTLAATTGFKQPITPPPKVRCSGCMKANARRKGLRHKVYSINMAMADSVAPDSEDEYFGPISESDEESGYQK